MDSEPYPSDWTAMHKIRELEQRLAALEPKAVRRDMSQDRPLGLVEIRNQFGNERAIVAKALTDILNLNVISHGQARGPEEAIRASVQQTLVMLLGHALLGDDWEPELWT